MAVSDDLRGLAAEDVVYPQQDYGYWTKRGIPREATTGTRRSWVFNASTGQNGVCLVYVRVRVREAGPTCQPVPGIFP
jgi:hypothetical protein